MTFNSNHIEGNRLSEDEIRRIFETNTVGSNALVNDIIETINHFKAIDYCIDIANEELNEDIIKNIHYILKNNTKDANLDWFNVGEYKLKVNMIGNLKTTNPKNVSKKNGKTYS